MRIDHVDVVTYLLLILYDVSTHTEIFFNRQSGENMAALWDMREAKINNLIGLYFLQILTVQQYFTCGGGQKTGDGV